MPPRVTRAFTLIELLTVVAIIGILVSLTVGGLAQAKARAHRITCLNNQRELHTVWHKFADDNDDRLVVNSNPIGNINPVTTNVPWASGGVHQFYATVTNEVFLTDPQYSAFAYAKLSPRLYRCGAIKHNIQGRPMIRHYSMNPYLGLQSASSFGAPPGFEVYRRMNDVTQPSERAVLVEMNPYIICTTAVRINAMQTDTNSPTAGQIISGDFATLPIFPHGKSTVVSFVDGHVDQQKRQTDEMDRVWPVDWIADHQNLHASDNADFVWFANRFTRGR
jgi:prepilin-type N-terminal cleavage/methylation domain-containing protein/prepilin-type processing-associated H-X9-DG protein